MAPIQGFLQNNFMLMYNMHQGYMLYCMTQKNKISHFYNKDIAMNTIAEIMSADHNSCDNEFALAEQAALANNWSEAETAFNAFRNDMAHHFKMEEEVLFPTLIAAGGPSGPVQVMRMEHTQIRGLLEQMAAAVAYKDAEEYGGLSETLLIVMQQHNHKEEQILYPMADQILAAEREALFERMRAI